MPRKKKVKDLSVAKILERQYLYQCDGVWSGLKASFGIWERFPKPLDAYLVRARRIAQLGEIERVDLSIFAFERLDGTPLGVAFELVADFIPSGEGVSCRDPVYCYASGEGLAVEMATPLEGSTQTGIRKIQYHFNSDSKMLALVLK